MKLHAAAATFLLFLGRFSSSKSHDLSDVAEDRQTCNRCRLPASLKQSQVMREREENDTV